MRGIPPGEYKLIALDELPPGAQYDPEFLRPLEARVKPFKVEKNDRIEMAVTITRPAGFDRYFSGHAQQQ